MNTTELQVHDRLRAWIENAAFDNTSGVTPEHLEVALRMTHTQLKLALYGLTSEAITQNLIFMYSDNGEDQNNAAAYI